MNGGLEIGEVVDGRYQVRGFTMSGPAYADYRVFDREVEVELSLWWMDAGLYADETPRVAFESGARSVKKLGHPALRRLYDAGRSPGGLYAALQLAAPDPVLSRLGSGRPGSEADLLRYATAMSEALEAAHAAGYVHGRLVPSDVVEVAGQVKLSGIGLYRGLDPVLVAERWGELRRYLAPEVLESGVATARSDVFSMAAVLAELASGMAHRDLDETIELLAGDQGALADVLSRAVSRAPDRRPARPSDLLAMVRRLFVDSARATLPPQAAAGEETPPGLPPFGEEDDLNDKTIEESSPLFKDPSAAPRSPLFGPNAPTLLGRRSAAVRPPSAVVKPEPALDRDEEENALAETVIEPPGSAPVSVPIQSHKPPADEPAPQSTPLVPAIDRPELQPVLRPISSVQKPSYPPGALGHYAPPRDAVLAEPGRRRWPLYLLVAMIAAAGAGLAIGIAVTRDRDGGEDPGVTVDPAPPPDQQPAPPPPPPQPVVKPVEPCGPEMVLVHGELLRAAKRPFCIDRHESPGSGMPPQLRVGHGDAETACRTRGARLCSPAEWEDGCRGPDEASFPYGPAYVARKCNTRGEEIAPAGSFPECMSASGAIDMSGNAAEWDSSGAARGASATDGARGRCSDRRAMTPSSPLDDVGFRCCADPVAEVGPGK